MTVAVGRPGGTAAARMAVSPRRLLHGGATVSTGLAVEYGAQMLRTLVLARLLGPTEFGIVVSLNALSALVEMSTHVGADRFLVHESDGGSPALLAVSHTLNLGRGVVGAVLVLALAWPTAWLLSVPQALGSFLALAGLPLVRAFVNLRVQQVQREHVFWPDAAATIVGNVGGVVLTIIAALVLRDHRALLVGLYTTAFLNVLATHVLARVPYRLSLQSDGLRRALRFGLPLTVNGLSLALLGQLDRILVGALLGVTVLGRYGLATTLVAMPTSLIFRVGMSVSQPYLSAAWRDGVPGALPRLYRGMTFGFAVLALVFAIGVATLGDPLLRLVFGPAYAVGDGFMALLSFGILIRFAKGTANLGGLAIGRTVDLMLSNAAGASSLLFTAGFLLLWPHIIMAAAGYLAGDVLGALVITTRLGGYLRGRSDPSPYRGFLIAVPVQVVVILWVLQAGPSLPARAAIAAAAIILAGIVAGRRTLRVR